MSRKVAILRGINVGGKRKILMTDLKKMFEGLNYSNVITYIQSGNVIFDSDPDLNDLELSFKIEEAIQRDFGFDVPVNVRAPGELKAAVNENPFFKDGYDVEHLHLTFLKENPSDENRKKTESYNYEPDQFIINGKDVFVYCEGKYHQSKLTNDFFEKKLKTTATTRNWKTILKLLELMDE